MSLLVQAAVAAAALIFIGVSAAMNAVFLSSLGQTPTEATLLTAVSLSADLAKAVLPVLIVRAVVIRSWWHASIAAVMLALLVVLSLTSGTGFAALTRNAATASRAALAERLDAHRRHLRDTEAALSSLPAARQTAVVEADIEAARIDWAWTATKGCTEIAGASNRRFCSGVAILRAEFVAAQTRDRLTAERDGTRTNQDALQQAGASGESDPQAAAIAAVLKVDPALPRVVLPVSIAIVLELGAVVLVLLWAGPTVRGWKHDDRQSPPVAKPLAVDIQPPPPHPPDPVGWQLQRSRSRLTDNRGGNDAR